MRAVGARELHFINHAARRVKARSARKRREKFRKIRIDLSGDFCPRIKAQTGFQTGLNQRKFHAQRSLPMEVVAALNVVPAGGWHLTLAQTCYVTEVKN